MRAPGVSRLTALLLVALLGCANLVQRIESTRLPGVAHGPTEADVRRELGSWAGTFAALVTSASDRIRNESKQRDVRRNTLLWQLRIIPLARQAAYLPDVQQAYVASLALANAQLDYLTKGEGRTRFGAQQPIAVEAAEGLEADLVDLGRSFLDERQLTRLQGQVDELVTRNPIRGSFAADSFVSGLSESTTEGGMLSWVVDLPMVPFRALAGVSDTAQAVSDFNDTARAFTETVNELPHQTRWELELLLYDAEELDTVERALAAGENVATAADRMSAVAETLPEELGTELAARLAEARATIAELDQALERAESLSGTLVRVSDRVGEASQQWTTLLAEMQSDDSGADDHPFDIREYGDAATRIGDAGRQLQSLVAAVQSLDPVATRGLLDALVWRAALLIGVFFAGLIAYRIVATRIR
jgi:hypothetical protein